MTRPYLTTTAFMALMIAAPLAAAQQAVPVRSSQHESYTRIVFDWNENTAYKISQEAAGKLALSFDAVAALDTNTLNLQPGLPVTGVVAGADGKSASIALTPGATYRHFKSGNKIVVDVLPASSADVKATAPSSAPVATATPDAPPPFPQVAAAAVHTVEKSTLVKLLPKIEPHIITVSATEKFGMALFERNGWLWLIVDRPAAANVPPQIAGPQSKSFSPFEKIELQGGGTAYRTRLPGEARTLKARGEGGGLIWRILLSPTRGNEMKPAQMERLSPPAGSTQGPAAVWSMGGVTKIFDVPDPESGDVLKVVAVESSTQFAGGPYGFVDFNVLPSFIGLAVQPKTDDIMIEAVSGNVKVTRPLGLSLSSPKDINTHNMRVNVQESAILVNEPETEGEMKRIYDFDRWMMGGIQALTDNERILMTTLTSKDKDEKIQDLLTIAKMNVANDRGQEALGHLSIAIDEMPLLIDNLEFLALRGAAYALSGKYELAWTDFENPGLKDFSELDYWRAYTLAWLEDWQQAHKILPKNTALIVEYPKPLLEKLAVKLIEISLRAGDVDSASRLLARMQKDRENFSPWTVAGMDYLKGESQRQNKLYDDAIKTWEPLTESKDRLYRAKAGLALTMLQQQTGKATIEQAVDRLEGLRYAWRGDELEAQINYMLGKLYLDSKRYVKGFAILRDAATMALPDSNIGQEVAYYMAQSYRDLLMKDKEVTPLDAVTVYEEFKELTPTDAEGDVLIQKLAERLVEADLLTRSTSLLQHQVDFRLQGIEKGRVALRLAALYLLDNSPRPAVAALDAAKAVYESVPDLNADLRRAKLREIELLRARAMSKMNRTEEAITLLNTFEPKPDVNYLRADISWKAGLWEDAAEALQDLILDEALDMQRPLTDKQADLILNRAVALNLSGNRVALANTRTRYSESMAKTPRGRLFDVVTRPRKVASLSDTETISALVAEVDLFKEFLESYKKDTEDMKPPEEAPTTPATAPNQNSEPATR